LVAQGAAILIPERELTAEKLAAELARLAADRKTLLTMAECARRMARPESTAELGAACLAAGGLPMEAAA
jgi:UDP-N-acetylglucosamine--N-acetylmuramyl-(pentapeptide) pyrophosphoryl-undecaprenol N-acetylglucosamine transferase